MTQRVLFLCTHNSSRSQMAQGLLNWLAPDRFTALSAGTHPSTIHPLAIRVMQELGIDIRNHGTHQVSDYYGQPFDTVITVCESAAEECPVFPGAKVQLHWSFADPAAVTGDEATRLAAFRHTRDLILVRLRRWVGKDA
jgi:arsenate reductase